jgi:DNA-binding transcriptional MerR regulator
MNDEIEKVYFSISEVAKMMDIATSNIRFWESEFPWLTPYWNKLGHRQYNRDIANEVLRVNFLVNIAGMTLPGVQQLRVLGNYDAAITFFENAMGTECKHL